VSDARSRGAGPWGAAGLGGAALLVLAACGDGRSPTGAAGVGETRQVTAEQSVRGADVIDALFLGSGPLIPRNGVTECPFPGVWSGYPRGSVVRVRLSTRLPPAVVDALRQAVAPVAEATARALTLRVERTAEADPQPGVDEVTVTEHPLPRAAGCGSDAGCVDYRFAGRGLLMGARVVEGPGQGVARYARDVVGHAILGLCAIDARRVGGAEQSLMSGGVGVGPGAGASSLTPLDLDAVRAVYASGLSPGAPRAAFLAARLVNLQAGELPRPR
jgi:hypothetical protein